TVITNMEQRINLKSLVKLGRSPTECLKISWHKCFKRGHEEVDDDPKSGRPSTTKMDENIERVKQLVQSDHRLTARMMVEQLSLNRESVRTILVEDLGTRKVCAKMAHQFLANKQITALDHPSEGHQGGGLSQVLQWVAESIAEVSTSLVNTMRI
uniref:Mos1 transposase HTH domain-containing protein n=1 Tax=Sphaeramia orbicularis TaxID=375764 RepID=A0A672ZUH4_9TELE